MGMSASQARFLMLTAQKSNNEFQAQNLSFERLSLSQQSEQAVKEYNDKVNARMLVFRNFDPTTNTTKQSQLTYANIVSEPPEGLGYRLVSTTGRIVVPSYPSGTSEADKGKYLIDTDLNNADLLEKNLRAANYTIQIPSDESNTGFENISIDAATFISEEYRSLDLPRAEAEFNMKKEKFQLYDKKLELKLKQLDSEHKALETEMESVQKVIQKNVETTFKTFG